MTTYGYGKNKGKREVYTKEEIDNVNVEVNITLESGFEFVPRAENRCVYNKLTKQCTLYFRVVGTINIDGTATTIYKIPDLYRPTNIVYGNATFGNTVNGQVSVKPTGEVNVLPIQDGDTPIVFTVGQISWIVDGLVGEGEYTLGDVNGDGQITIEDANLVQSYIMSETALTKKQLQAADVNKDGKVSSTDYVKIKEYAEGTINSFE